MSLLILGLLIFLGVHSVRIFADDWRTAQRQRLGEAKWKAMYSMVSIIGFVLLIWGFGLARANPVVIWSPPAFTRHVAALLMLFSFILLAAAYVPGNSIKARLHHPMVIAVKVWALAHLISNGTLAEMILFDAFLLWAVVDFAAARRRDRLMGTQYPAGRTGPTIVTVVLGLLAFAVFAFWLHRVLIGVPPFAMTA